MEQFLPATFYAFFEVCTTEKMVWTGVKKRLEEGYTEEDLQKYAESIGCDNFVYYIPEKDWIIACKYYPELKGWRGKAWWYFVPDFLLVFEDNGDVDEHATLLKMEEFLESPPIPLEGVWRIMD